MSSNAKQRIGIVVALGLVVVAVGLYAWHQGRRSNTRERQTSVASLEEYSVATFAGGCFWCTEADFEKTVGVVEAISGYTGGDVENPTYKQVSSGTSGHVEAVQVYYDERLVSYDQLLDVYWRHIDPTDAGGSFVDRGEQYGSAIFYHTPEQKEVAEASKDALANLNVFDDPIVTPILPVSTFYIAEDYHQDYHELRAKTYAYYRSRSGRDQFIEAVWGDGLKEAQQHGHKEGRKHRCVGDVCFEKPTDAELRAQLTDEQYRITQNDGTETPFENAYWDNKEEGIYVDIVSGEPLFSSTDKYVSGTGWPSFVKPISDDAVTLHDDWSLFVKCTEVRSALADSHVGHVFNDGPEDRGGLRWCMNSAAMRFVPKEDLVGRYQEYRTLFE